MDDTNHDSNKSEIILAQWRTCVEMANSVSQRRDSMNNIFITLNLAILATISISWNIKSLFLLASGIVFCCVWLAFIKNYMLLNCEKFKVIDSLESQLPAHPFREEWGKLQKVKKYKDGTFLEKVLPITFICIYGFAFLRTVKTKFLHKGDFMIYNLFISHSWSYSDAYDGLVSLLDSNPYFNYKNYSVPKDDPIHNARYDYQLKEAIRNQMQHTSCVLILAGIYSTYSKWINIEIALAQEMGKKIIAVEPWDSEKTSRVVKNAADVIVKWRTDSIIYTIRGY